MRTILETFCVRRLRNNCLKTVLRVEPSSLGLPVVFSPPKNVGYPTGLIPPKANTVGGTQSGVPCSRATVAAPSSHSRRSSSSPSFSDRPRRPSRGLSGPLQQGGGVCGKRVVVVCSPLSASRRGELEVSWVHFFGISWGFNNTAASMGGAALGGHPWESKLKLWKLVVGIATLVNNRQVKFLYRTVQHSTAPHNTVQGNAVICLHCGQ